MREAAPPPNTGWTVRGVPVKVFGSELIVLNRHHAMAEGEISFGRFRLDVARRELSRDNRPVQLGGRALDILCVLASADGAVVTKDELMARVSPTT